MRRLSESVQGSEEAPPTNGRELKIDYNKSTQTCPGGLAYASSKCSCSNVSATTAMCTAAKGCQCTDCAPAPVCRVGGVRSGNLTECDLDTSGHVAWNTSCEENCPWEESTGRSFTTSEGAVTARIEEASSVNASEPKECDWSTWPLNVTSAAETAAAVQAPGDSVVDHFKKVALAEHVSVASFSRTVLDLMEHAAPPWLLDRTLLAAREEIQHAQMAFALVRMWSAPAQPTGFNGQLGAQSTLTLTEFAQRTITEACLGETPAVLRAALSLHFAQDPKVQEYFRVVVADEQRHAELAWTTVKWSLLKANGIHGETLTRAMRQKVHLAVQSALPAMKASASAAIGDMKAAESDIGLLRFGMLSQPMEMVVAQFAVPLIEQILSLLLAAPLEASEEVLPSFERSVSEHFQASLKELNQVAFSMQSSVV